MGQLVKVICFIFFFLLFIFLEHRKNNIIKLWSIYFTVGHTANYAVVVAQLYSQGECKGIHPFIVQLRDEETHEPLPGI